MLGKFGDQNKQISHNILVMGNDGAFVNFSFALYFQPDFLGNSRVIRRRDIFLIRKFSDNQFNSEFNLQKMIS